LPTARRSRSRATGASTSRPKNARLAYVEKADADYTESRTGGTFDVTGMQVSVTLDGATAIELRGAIHMESQAANTQSFLALVQVGTGNVEQIHFIPGVSGARLKQNFLKEMGILAAGTYTFKLSVFNSNSGVIFRIGADHPATLAIYSA
jgi:hypothetical protein